jgi:hypothetical protein
MLRFFTPGEAQEITYDLQFNNIGTGLALSWYYRFLKIRVPSKCWCHMRFFTCYTIEDMIYDAGASPWGQGMRTTPLWEKSLKFTMKIHYTENNLWNWPWKSCFWENDPPVMSLSMTMCCTTLCILWHFQYDCQGSHLELCGWACHNLRMLSFVVLKARLLICNHHTKIPM